MNSTEKRKATVFKKKEKKARKEVYQNKKAVIGGVKYSEYQLIYVNENKRF